MSRKLFSTTVRKGLPVSPHFAITDSVSQIKERYSSKIGDSLAVLKTGGRVIGRRKASKNLIFLDVSSNGSSVQVMLDKAKIANAEHTEFKDLAEAT